VEKSFWLNSGSWVLPAGIWIVFQLAVNFGWAQSPLPGAVGQQAVTDAAAQQERERQRQLALQPREEEKPPVEATAVSEDFGSVQLMREIPSLPFLRLRADQSYNWLSNANYAKNSQNVVAAWQTVSSLEAAWAPTFTTMPGYDKFFPEAGVRASFFNYFQQEEPSQTNNGAGLYDIGLVQDFVLMNLFLRGTRQITDELSVGLSFDYNGYFYLNSPEERAASGQTGESNFLNEFALAYTSSYFHAFTDRHAVAVNWRASYVFASSPGTEAGFSPSYLTRTDNSLTGTYFLTLSEKISLTPFASYRLAYYTDASNAPLSEDFNDQGQPTGFANGFYRRLDQQYTLGLGLNFQLSPELSTALNFNYSKSDSTSQIAETGDFTNLTAGANWSMTYKFSDKEFVVAEPSDCLGPYVRTDLGFGFVNNLASSQTLTGAVLPGITGTLSHPSLSINPGLRFDVTPGYNFNDWLGAEFSAGILYNGLDHLNGSGSVIMDGSPTPVTVGGGGVSLTGRYLQVPALASAVFRWPGQSRWKPYLSTGFGLAYSQLQISQVGTVQTSDQMSQQFSPAFQIGSGFLWQVSDTVDFDVMYKLLGIINPDYSSFQPGVVLSNSFQFGINIRF
jgi:opacity protein-like surface antigen